MTSTTQKTALGLRRVARMACARSGSPSVAREGRRAQMQEPRPWTTQSMASTESARRGLAMGAALCDAATR